jgi:60 kDa SS-A/Ro ribonucleoprotein
MANRTLFATPKINPPVADTTNKSGGRAYKMTDQHALAQLIVTSCFNDTYYASATEQLETVKKLADSCETEFVAKAAVYAFETAKMRDTAIFLLAKLTTRGDEGLRLFAKAFPRIVVNVGMLRNFVQVIRSGQVGRKSFGTVPQRVIREWLASKSPAWLFTGSIGTEPTFADVIKMIRPKPESAEKKAFYAYMIDRPHDINLLPENVANFELFKVAKATGVSYPVPDVPFQMLSSLKLTSEDWTAIAKNMPWKALQKNLATLGRHGVYDDRKMVTLVADRIRDPEAVRRANVFPYQLMTAYKYTESVPSEVRNALQEAMEVATENVPAFSKDVAFFLDVSASMRDIPITGNRVGSSTKTLCVEVAALMAATVLRRNRNAMFLPFDLQVFTNHSINPFDSVVTNAQKMSKLGGGGTDCAGPLRVLNGLVGKQNKPELVIIASDNESWHLNGGSWHNHYWRSHGRQMGITTQPTSVAAEWAKYKKSVPTAKLVCIDLVPDTTTQIKDGQDILNIGGFSDAIWPVIEKFSRGIKTTFAGEINDVTL